MLLDPGGSSNMLMERLTETGSVLGTWAYMAPEQLVSRPAGAKSDQFAFCVALYEALGGSLPFSEEPREALRAMASGTSRSPLPMPAGSQVPRWLQRAIVRGLAGDPEARWPSMASLLRALEHGRRGVGVRRWALAGAGLLALALVGVALWQEPPCADVAEPLRGVWDEPRRQAVGEAILATGLPYAEQTRQTVQRQLDDYADRWVQGSRSACEATRVHHEQSPEELELRTQCLWRRRAALEYDVELLTEADAERVERAVELVAGLPAVEPCADVSALTKASGTSRTPQQRAALEELEGSLERVRARSALGRYEEALAVIEPLLTRIRTGASEPVLLAEAQVLRGQLFQELSRHREAEQEYQQAQALALEHGADGAALEAMAGQIYLAGVVRDQTELALRLSTDTAQPLMRRVAPGSAVAAMILTATAQVLTMRGEHAQAESSYREALEVLGAIRGEDIVLADTLDGLAQ
ncbi:MAG: hypothetical protein KDK70_16960, partial [Myxococcales bacterium]|nr:hypothetical protein [Myxococcales bacterium]